MLGMFLELPVYFNTYFALSEFHR